MQCFTRYKVDCVILQAAVNGISIEELFKEKSKLFSYETEGFLAVRIIQSTATSAFTGKFS